MTDHLRKTANAVNICKDSMTELRNVSIEKRMLDAVSAMESSLKTAAVRFNECYAALNVCNNAIKTARKGSLEFMSAVSAINHGDYGLVIDSELEPKIKHLNVEDAGLFADAIKDIMAFTKVEKRMKACVEINAKINESIEGWRSKIDRMKRMSKTDGSTTNEVDVAQKKIVQFEYAIATLKKRGGQVSDIYFNAKKQLLDFIQKQEESFITIYHNDK